MKTKLLNIVDEIKGQQDYIENNSDFIDNYAILLPDLFTYNSENVFNSIRKLLPDNFNDNFIREFIEDELSYHDHYIELIGSCNYSVSENNLFTINLGEQEFYFNEANETLTSGQKEYIEQETDIVINDSNQLGYQTIYSHIEVNFIGSEITEYIDSLMSVQFYNLFYDNINVTWLDCLQFFNVVDNSELLKYDIIENYDTEATKIIFYDNSVLEFSNTSMNIGAR